MNCDKILSEITGHPTGQAFSHIDEFCNPRLMTFDEVFNILNSGKIEFPIEIVILPLEEVRLLRKEKKSRKKMFDGRIVFHSKKINRGFGFDVYEKKFIKAIFDQKCEIKNCYEECFIAYSRLEKYKWNIYCKKSYITIKARYDCGKKHIFVNFDIEIGLEVSALIFTIYKDNDIVKFYDIGA
jgi:hypothetical protein